MNTPHETPATDTDAGGTRTDQAVQWLAGHAAELAGVTAPVIVGAFTTAWLDLLSVVAAGWWAVHEFREHRVRADIARHTLTTATAPRQLPHVTSGAPASPLRSEGSHR